MTKRNKNVKQRTKKKQLKNGVEKEYKYWVVDIGRIGIDGKGRFKSFKKKTEADKYARRKDIEKEQYGKEALKFSDNNRSDALNAMKALNGHTTLEESAKFYIKHHVSIAKKMTVTSLWDEFILSKKNANRRPFTIKDAKDKLGRFKKDHENVILSTITSNALEKWIANLNSTDSAKSAYIKHLKSFFKYAADRNYVPDNPAKFLVKPHVETSLPYVMPVDDIKKLLCVTMEDHLDMMPYFSLGIFAGIRPFEIRRLNWQDINFQKSEIYIPKDVSKTRTDRLINISKNLTQWLKLTSRNNRKNKIFFSRKKFDDIRKKTVITWSADCMRHSFGSYHSVFYNNINSTIAQMGHRTPQTLFKHYKRVVRPADAKRFWGIVPKMKHWKGCQHV